MNIEYLWSACGGSFYYCAIKIIKLIEFINLSFDISHYSFLEFLRINIDDDVFQIRVDVQGFRAGLPGAVAGLL